MLHTYKNKWKTKNAQIWKLRTKQRKIKLEKKLEYFKVINFIKEF